MATICEAPRSESTQAIVDTMAGIHRAKSVPRSSPFMAFGQFREVGVDVVDVDVVAVEEAGGERGKAGVTEKDIKWFNTSDDQTPEAFFNHLRTTDRKKAQLRYRRVLDDCDATAAYRRRLVEEFDAWISGEADSYWEERVASETIKQIQIRTAAALVRTSETLAVKLMESNAREA